METTRLAILEAAGRALARRGLEGTTVHDIARESGYTAASLYAYFPGKQAIVQALLALLQREILETFDLPLPEGLTFAQSLELLVRRQAELADRRREALVVFIQCGRAAHALRASREQAGFELYVPRLAAWLGRHARPGDLGSLSPEESATFFAGLAHAFFHTWMRGREEPAFVRRTQFLVQLFLHGVRGTAWRPAAPARRRSR